MAPLLRQASSSLRIPHSRPTGDRESGVPIWNGSARDTQETPASSSNLHFPRGDDGIEDPEMCSSSSFDASVDKEISPAAVMSQDPTAVTKIRDQLAKRWENDERDLFAPVPIPDPPTPRKELSLQGDPPILPDSCEGPLGVRKSNLTKPGQANTTGVAFVPDSKQVNPCFLNRPQRPSMIDAFSVPQSLEGGAPEAPSPTRPDRPGTEMPGRDDSWPLSPPLSPMLASSRHRPPILMQDDAEILPMPPMPPPAPLAPPTEPRLQSHLVPLIPPAPEVATVTLEAILSPTIRGNRSRSAGPGGRKLKKSVSFSSLDPVSYGIQPYSEVYGEHPKNFHFDSDGNKVSNMQARLLDFKQDWLEKHEGPSWDDWGGYQEGFHQREFQPIF